MSRRCVCVYMDAVDDAPLSSASLSKLRWRCRRGMLENDLLIARFFAQHAQGLTERQSLGLQALMDLSDPDLLDLLLARSEPTGALDRPEVHWVLARMQSRPLAVAQGAARL